MDDITKHPHPHPHGAENPSVSHERGDADVFTISKYGIGLAIGVVIVVFAMWGLFDWFYSRESGKPVDVPLQVLKERPTRPPEPRLQAQPKVELKDLRDSEAALLEGYGWIDPDKGTVRIPIKDAIDAVAQKGLPSKPSADGGVENGYRQIPSVSSSGRVMEKITQ